MTAPHDERGAAALLTTLVALLLAALVMAVGLAAARIWHAAAAARTAADAAALAALAGSPLAGGDGPPDLTAARATAAANGGELVEVDDAAWPVAVVVHVRTWTGPTPIGSRPLTAAAAARLVRPDGATLAARRTAGPSPVQPPTARPPAATAHPGPVVGRPP
ncbi:hypothetical protein [Euzebya sp.]|uniref:hypothetical protein n=1 Tax=Euzebya sp. TaxID=1971409 RepID=UPI00351361CC